MSDHTIEPKRARDMLADGEARGIDMRPIEEVGQPHAPGAVFVGDRDLDDVAEQVLRGEEAKLILFCADGSESADAARRLSEDGHEALAVEGGWQAWSSGGLPVQPRDDQEYEGPTLKQPGTGGSLGPEGEDDEELPEEDSASGEEEGREAGV